MGTSKAPLHIVAANTMNGDEYHKAVQRERKTRTIRKLLDQLVDLGVPMPEINYTGLVAGRKWEADLYWSGARLVAEYEGGTNTHMRAADPYTGNLAQSRHLTPSGFSGDCEKYNALAMQGVLVMRADYNLVKSGLAAQQIASVYFDRMAEAEVDALLAFRQAIKQLGPQEVWRLARSFAAGRGGDLA